MHLKTESESLNSSNKNRPSISANRVKLGGKRYSLLEQKEDTMSGAKWAIKNEGLYKCYISARATLVQATRSGRVLAAIRSVCSALGISLHALLALEEAEGV
jgi:hypothetical protein